MEISWAEQATQQKFQYYDDDDDDDDKDDRLRPCAIYRCMKIPYIKVYVETC